jgi:hypothetical protein
MSQLSTLATPSASKLRKPQAGPQPRAPRALYNAIEHERADVDRQRAKRLSTAAKLATLRERAQALQEAKAKAAPGTPQRAAA